MNGIYITHYYHHGTDPWKNIMLLPREEAFRKARELADEHPDTMCFGRFADFENYYPHRRSADEYMKREFEKLGGKPLLGHPYSFVLFESEYLDDWFGNGDRLKIYLDDIPDDIISFTFGDSCAQFAHGIKPAVLTKQMLIDEIRSHGDSAETFMQFVHTKCKYVEVQLWAKI